MPEITDLDMLIPDDKKVLLGGTTYVLPGDMPMETYLRVNKAAQMQEAGADQEKLLRSMVDALVELFCWRVPVENTAKRDTVEKVLLGLGVRTITALLGKIYPADEDEVAEVVDAASVDPPKEAVDGKMTTTSS